MRWPAEIVGDHRVKVLRALQARTPSARRPWLPCPGFVHPHMSLNAGIMGHVNGLKGPYPNRHRRASRRCSGRCSPTRPVVLAKPPDDSTPMKANGTGIVRRRRRRSGQLLGRALARFLAERSLKYTPHSRQRPGQVMGRGTRRAEIRSASVEMGVRRVRPQRKCHAVGGSRPISGAPRTPLVRIACAASSTVSRSIVVNSNGRRD